MWKQILPDGRSLAADIEKTLYSLRNHDTINYLKSEIFVVVINGRISLCLKIILK